MGWGWFLGTGSQDFLEPKAQAGKSLSQLDSRSGPAVHRELFVNFGQARAVVRAAIVFILSHSASVAAQRAPVSPDHPWHGLGEARIEAAARNSTEPGLSFDQEKTYSLAELIDLAESHNPETRVAWEHARAQAADWGVARSELYPTVAAAALAGVDREQAYLADRFFRQTIGDFQVALNLNYTVFDFGARSGRINAAKAQLLAANFAANPNRTITTFDTTGLLPIGAPITYTNAFVANLNPLTAPAFPNKPSTTPRDVTWNGQIEHELHKNLQLRVGYLDSHATYLFTVNPFTSAVGGQSFEGLTNTGSSHYREMEASAHYSLREHDQIIVSYIWSRARGDLNSLSSVYIPFAAPVIRPNLYGILPSDIPNRVVGWGIFALPWKLTFSPLVDVHSGFPYSPIDVQQQYVGTPNGKRFPEYFSLDMKLYRQFRVPLLGNRGGKVHHVRLGVYTLNVTNHGNFNAVYNNVASPNFGQFVGFLYRHEGMVIDFVD